MGRTPTKRTGPGSIKTHLGKACHGADCFGVRAMCQKKKMERRCLRPTCARYIMWRVCRIRGIGACARYAMRPIDRGSFDDPEVSTFRVASTVVTTGVSLRARGKVTCYRHRPPLARVHWWWWWRGCRANQKMNLERGGRRYMMRRTCRRVCIVGR